MRLQQTPDAASQLQTQLAKLSDNDLILVTSTQAASQAKALWDAQPSPPDLSHYHCFAVGSSSAQILSEFASFSYPKVETSEALWDMIKDKKLALTSSKSSLKQKALILKGEGGRKFLKSSLQQVGCLVVECNMYRRQSILPKVDASHWQNQHIDCVVVTSGELMNTAFQYFPKAWLTSLHWIVVSERMAAIAYEHGIKHVFVSSAANDKALLEAVRQFPEGKHD